MSEELGRLLVLVGLPGSGKSTLLSGKFAEESPDVLVFDDYQAEAIDDNPDPQWSRHRKEVIAALKEGRSVLVSDISYCRPDGVARLLEQMRDDVPGLVVEIRGFENDPADAAHNVRLRGRDQVERELILIEQLSKVYEAPPDAMPITRGQLSRETLCRG